jgi:hypothetical protein
MEPGGTRVSLRAVVGGMFLLWVGYYLEEAQSINKPMLVLAGCFSLLFLSAGGLAVMFRKTRTDRAQRGLRRWFLETLKLTGTLVIGALTLFVALRGYDLLAR